MFSFVIRDNFLYISIFTKNSEILEINYYFSNFRIRISRRRKLDEKLPRVPKIILFQSTAPCWKMKFSGLKLKISRSPPTPAAFHCSLLRTETSSHIVLGVRISLTSRPPRTLSLPCPPKVRNCWEVLVRLPVRSPRFRSKCWTPRSCRTIST